MKFDRHINLRIPDRMHAVFARRARETGSPLSEVLRQAMASGIPASDEPTKQERAH
ncbi:hypothetical protein [Ancylobacter sp.]|uniref:hypothetical protein n=1 Tax=Ancylobacter sp. TaxID=1872567 RepID=UPI003D0A3B0E